MISETLQKKINRAIKLLQSATIDGKTIEVAYSGGKDSDVILQLVKESGIPYRAIYKMTTIDPPGTVKHVRDMGVEIIRPKINFAQLIAKKGQPNRRRRFCCFVLKEYKILDRAIIGIRREESVKRTKRYIENTQCRRYKRNECVEQFFPILDWTLQDVVDFAKDRNIKFAPVYYDADGSLHPERRLGCMCCPLASKKHRIEEFRKYPNMVKLYIKGIQQYIDKHPNSKVSKYTAYEAFAHDVFFNKKGEWAQVNARDMFGFTPDWKDFIQKQFNVTI